MTARGSYQRKAYRSPGKEPTPTLTPFEEDVRNYIRIRDIVRTETAAGLRATYERQVYMMDLDRKIKRVLRARNQK